MTQSITQAKDTAIALKYLTEAKSVWNYEYENISFISYNFNIDTISHPSQPWHA